MLLSLEDMFIENLNGKIFTLHLKIQRRLAWATSFMVGLSASFAAYLTMEQIPVKIYTSML